jgi:hypothetical protein
MCGRKYVYVENLDVRKILKNYAVKKYKIIKFTDNIPSYIESPEIVNQMMDELDCLHSKCAHSIDFRCYFYLKHEDKFFLYLYPVRYSDKIDNPTFLIIKE